MQEHSIKGASHRPPSTRFKAAKAAAPALTAALMGFCAASALAAPAYKAAGAVPLGDPAFWDYAVSDPITGRVYVAHADKVAVIDGRTGKLIGNVEGIPGGTHGIAISAATGQGFSDDGRNGQAIVFDLKTLKVKVRIPADQDADGVALDRGTGHVFFVDGDPKKITVVDPKTDTAAATIDVGEKMEYPVASNDKLFIAGVEKRDLIEVDPRTNGVIARWPIPDCEAPHGLAVDGRSHRAFVGCVNFKMMVVDTRNGKLVTELNIGRGNDAVAYDSNRKRVFSSNGRDGTISVFEQVSPDKYTQLEDIKTAVSGRTMTVDTVTGRLFVPAADQDPNSPPGQRPKMLPGTTRVLMFDPVG